jgi:hypothetical protein
MPPFDPVHWRGSLPFTVREPAGLERRRAVVEVPFSIAGAAGLPARELRIVRDAPAPRDVPAQFHHLGATGDALTGRALFFTDLAAGETQGFRLYYGNPRAEQPAYTSGLNVAKGPDGPQHYWIENEFYKIETMPKSGQIWHVWNTQGSNTSWHHNEWIENTEKGGDPCHWAPNCWVAYPERVTFGYQLREDRDVDLFDWHYVFGWDNPESEATCGPLFFELRRWGPVWPHPEHSNPLIKRDRRVRIRAEVVYRFYADLPWFHQSSWEETLEDLKVFFIRNSQFVFLDRVFTHAIIAPEPTGVRPTDAVTPAVIRLLAKENLKPFPRVQHSLSNVLPSKLDYLGFYNEQNGDAFTQFQRLERNTNLFTGVPTYRNHAMILTELHDWSVYFMRAFSYTNQRFNPENATFLPKGERYEEENVCLIHRHESLPDTLARQARLSRELAAPPVVEFQHARA